MSCLESWVLRHIHHRDGSRIIWYNRWWGPVDVTMTWQWLVADGLLVCQCSWGGIVYARVGCLNNQCERHENWEVTPILFVTMDVKGKESNSIGAAGPTLQWAHIWRGFYDVKVDDFVDVCWKQPVWLQAIGYTLPKWNLPVSRYCVMVSGYPRGMASSLKFRLYDVIP